MSLLNPNKTKTKWKEKATARYKTEQRLSNKTQSSGQGFFFVYEKRKMEWNKPLGRFCL